MESRLKHTLFIATIASFMMTIFLDQNGIGVTLSYIQKTFGISNTALQWVMNSMLIAAAVSMLIAGKLGDLFGTRRMFIIGIIGFMLASILCGVAPTIDWVFVGRALQGVTASLMLTNYIVLIHHQYPKTQWPKVLGTCISISAVFGAAAPAIAGILTQWLSWRGFFLINIPICMISLILTFLIIKKVAVHATNKSIDYIGMVLLVIAVASMVSAFTEASQFGWNNTGIITALIISVALFVVFFFFEKHHQNPLLHFEVLKDPLVLVGNVIIFCLQLSLICTVYFAIWMQHVLDFSPFATGLAYLPQTVPVIVMATLSGHWASHKGFRAPIVFGLTLAAIAIAVLTATFLKREYAWLAPFLLLWSVGASCAFPTTVSALLSNVDAAHKGMVVGINQTVRSLAAAIGLALFSTILVGIYGNRSFVDSSASKIAYTHAFVYAMLLPTTLTVLAALLAWRYLYDSDER